MKLFSIRNGFLEKESKKLGVDVVSHAFNRSVPTKEEIKKLILHVKDEKPDVFFIWKDPQVLPNVLEAIKRVSSKTKIVMWWGDQRGVAVPALISSRKKVLDCLLMTNDDPAQHKMFHGMGIKHVYPFYHAFSPSEFTDTPAPITNQVLFGGNCFADKKFPLSKLRRNFIEEVNKKFNLVVYGGGWSFKTEKFILRDKFAKIVGRANINLGINHYNVHKYYNRRLWECVASGRLHLTYYVPGMEEDFENHKHLVWFKTHEEGIELIKKYLKDDVAREKIAKEGRKYFLENHSWEHRVKDFRKCLDKIL